MKLKILLLFFIGGFVAQGQDDAKSVQNIYNNSLSNGMSYTWLDYLSNEIGGRLSGSKGAEMAVAYTKSELEKLGLDKVWLQPVMVPKWVRGEKETGYFISDNQQHELNICALGGSIATPDE